MTIQAATPGNSTIYLEVSRREVLGWGIVLGTTGLLVGWLGLSKLDTDGLSNGVFAATLSASLLFCSLVHELIHAAGFLTFGKARWSSVEFGFRLWPLQLFIEVSDPAPAPAFAMAVLLPAATLGVGILLFGLATDSSVVMVLGMANLAGCSNDVVLATRALRLPPGSTVESDKKGNLARLPTE